MTTHRADVYLLITKKIGSWTRLFRLIMRHLPYGTRLDDGNEGVSSTFLRHFLCRLRFRLFGDKDNYFERFHATKRLGCFDECCYSIASSGYFFSDVFRFTSVAVPKVDNRFIFNEESRTCRDLVVLFTRSNSRSFNR